MKSQKSTILSPESARAAGYFVVSLTTLVIVTCSGAVNGPVTPEAAPVAAGAGPSTAAAGPGEGAVEKGRDGGVAVVTPPPLGRLDRFRAALAELKTKQRTSPVRVLWLGDSHAAADFWPDAVRRGLQADFGNGGLGYIFAGLRVYRHRGVKITRDGNWHTDPKHPSLWMRQDDGVFGLGGLRAVPEQSASAVSLELEPGAVEGRARWDVVFRLPSDKSRFQIDTGEGVRVVDASVAKAGAIGHVAWQAASTAPVKLGHAAGDPQILGAVVESENPGVVIDTLGVNGARIGTPLAWDAATWVDEARRRSPSLVVLAYGTNEVGDADAPARYGPQYDAMVARIRDAAPNTDCLIIGPTDREDAASMTLPRVAQVDAVERQSAERLGCAFFSAEEAMGGSGSNRRWADAAPALAASDHVHLTPRGYAEIGKLTLDALGFPPTP